MNKKVIIISSVILAVLVIGAVIGGFYYIQSQNLNIESITENCRNLQSYPKPKKYDN